ncbi:M1 family metallopeptidase [Christiangramia salexigens]|uniref:Aminopeptidase N n=1 Tax=Christiangramia salexigens TaxID=1913577 RepID=A0A1L3J3V8_9FLAO|nr:M1 family metallopeptidase [Christiangramia salexigens]APG59811.1 metallopeptidase [Christiangramia salexigens]
MRSLLKLIFVLIFSTGLSAQNPSVDIEKYSFGIELSDNDDIISGTTDIHYKLRSATDSIVLDLVMMDEAGKGMKVDSILSGGKILKFKQYNEKLAIVNPQDTSALKIYYHGVPKDGLIISKNKYGDRTFFGDNWPNRAHNWLPVIDHPSDKAFVDFKVTVPSHYQVVANGRLKELSNLESGEVYYHYSSEVALPTKVMVIGVAEFAVQHLEEIQDIPVSSWVYRENKEAGFYDYAQAKKVLEYFIEKIGPYPYSKLANVQSTTRFGGMENASNIFYFENSVTGKRESEFLIAHEIAHQWFGDSASETDWSHLWLSEGFATYLTDLYAEDTYGKAKLDEKLKDERDQVIAFSKKSNTPVVDSSRTNYIELLNANSYEKGAWTLHMLRRKIGDENFWSSIRQYYQKYKLSNASTEDLKNVFEEVSGQDLDAFFRQWVLQYGHPVIKSDWSYKRKTIQLTIEQLQENNFNFPLQIKFHYKDGTSEIKDLEISEKAENFEFRSDKKPVKIELDPETNLLFEEAGA